MNIKKILKYTATAVVGSLAVGLLVACSSSASKDSATKKKTIEVERLEQPSLSLMRIRTEN